MPLFSSMQNKYSHDAALLFPACCSKNILGYYALDLVDLNTKCSCFSLKGGKFYNRSLVILWLMIAGIPLYFGACNCSCHLIVAFPGHYLYIFSFKMCQFFCIFYKGGSTKSMRTTFCINSLYRGPVVQSMVELTAYCNVRLSTE